MTLNSPWFELVESGKKVFEGRRVTRTTRQIKVGLALCDPMPIFATKPFLRK